ncbi:MAG: ornithine carbamoyltransferase [Lachnospiraceae bacterium]|nr:ornithine carbamoyltransferase [Lachnospiraceae bacterium]
MTLKGRDFLTLKDYSDQEILYLLDLAAYFKKKKKNGELTDELRGKNVALIFEKTSTRTRCSFETAAHDLGMGTTYLDPSGSQIGKKESIADTAKVLSRIYDGIEYRGFGQEIVESLAENAEVPVWNGLTNEYHPTQILADMLTVREHLGSLKGKTLAYMGDARYNMGNSLMIGCSKLGLHFRAVAPEKYFPSKELVSQCEKWASESGGSILLTSDVNEGTKDADIVYTDVWVSMGEPDEVWEERIRDLSPYRVTMDVMNNTAKGSIFLHCLPAFHDLGTVIGKEIEKKYGIKEMEVTDEVFKKYENSVFDEAENRMHTIKAVMAATLRDWDI